jgi:multidrug resistance efflux pump
MSNTLEKAEHINLYSEEVHEIVGQTPKKLVRWSTYFFVSILVMVFSVCFFVKYTDTLRAEFVLSATDAPKTVRAKTPGKLENLLVDNNDTVKMGEILAWIESTASHLEVIRLSEELEGIWTNVRYNQWNKIVEHKPASFKKLGEIQGDYQIFISTHIGLCAYLNEGFFIQKAKLLKEEVSHLTELSYYQTDQEKVYEEDYQIAQADFIAREKLFKEGVIPLLEYKQEQSRLISKKIPINNVHSLIVTNKTSIANKRNELIQLEKQFADEKSIFLQALNTLISKVDEWKKAFLLIAPADGRVTWPMTLRKNQDVSRDQELFYISPMSSQYFGEMRLPQENFGKVKLGQDVLINLTGYPYSEYGKLKGKVSFVSEFPIPNAQNEHDRSYYLSVTLTNGLKTDLDYSVPFKNGLAGTGEIVLNKTSLINKLFYTVRSMFNKPK